MLTRHKAILAMAISLALYCGPARASIQGLNQIVTPDLQPVGLMSFTFQDQQKPLKNPRELQLELGLTDWFDVAINRDFSPAGTDVNVEIGLVNRDCFQLSVGALGTHEPLEYQPFTVAGYYSGKAAVIAGAQWQEAALLGLFGGTYEALPGVLITADYISGPHNFATIGVDYELTPSLHLSPALFFNNSGPSHSFVYWAVTWNAKAW